MDIYVYVYILIFEISSIIKNNYVHFFINHRLVINTKIYLAEVSKELKVLLRK